MKDHNYILISAVLVITFMLGMALGGYITDQARDEVLINRSIAEYCQKTGEISWKGECK